VTSPPETARAHFERTGHSTTETTENGAWCDTCGRLDLLEQLTVEVSPLLDALRDTFEPANVDWIKVECCRWCQSTTLKLPRFSVNGKIAMLKCPRCQKINMAQVRR
jgi:hypothetical protein